MDRLAAPIIVLFTVTFVWSQVSTDEALRRLHERQKQRVAATQPTSRPASGPTTKPVQKIVFVMDASGSMLAVNGACQREIRRAVQSSSIRMGRRFRRHSYESRTRNL